MLYWLSAIILQTIGRKRAKKSDDFSVNGHFSFFSSFFYILYPTNMSLLYFENFIWGTKHLHSNTTLTVQWLIHLYLWKKYIVINCAAPLSHNRNMLPSQPLQTVQYKLYSSLSMWLQSTLLRKNVFHLADALTSILWNYNHFHTEFLQLSSQISGISNSPYFPREQSHQMCRSFSTSLWKFQELSHFYLPQILKSSFHPGHQFFSPSFCLQTNVSLLMRPNHKLQLNKTRGK